MRIDWSNLGSRHFEIIDYWTDERIPGAIRWADTGTFEICVIRQLPPKPGSTARVMVAGPDGEVATDIIRRPFRVRVRDDAPDDIKATFSEYVQPSTTGEPSIHDRVMDALKEPSLVEMARKTEAILKHVRDN